MSIGSRIKELRENRNISRNDFATMIGVTVGAISNYENDVSSPKEPILFKIIETLECEPNYIFQDMVKIKNQNNDVTLAEYEHIKKYRFISTHSTDGASVVDTVLDREYSIAEKLKEQSEQIQKMDMEASAEIIPTRLWAYYGKIAAAGTSVEFSDMIAGTREYPITEMNQNADYVIGVNGDSMEPEYFDGDIVFVEKATHINIGDVGIFQKDNNIYIKKAGENGLISLKEGYPIITSEDGIRVLGKVLGKTDG